MIRPQKLRKKAKNAGRKDVYEKQNNSVGAACFGTCISSVVLRRGTRRGTGSGKTDAVTGTTGGKLILDNDGKGKIIFDGDAIRIPIFR